MLPPRRKKPRSNRPQTVFPAHRRWVKSHGCSVKGCNGAPIEFAHVRSAANSGTGLKPHDCFGISLCARCHNLQHRMGQPDFQRVYGIDMMAMAREFRRRSPDKAMRESLKLRETEDAAVE